MEASIKSPFTGGKVNVIVEKRKIKYRGKEYEYTDVSYKCMDTGESFSTTAMDDANITQVYNKYREENGIPFTDEIIGFRKTYGLTAKAMSDIIGFGDNQYRLYENGEIPNVSNGRMLANLIASPDAFILTLNAAKKQIDRQTFITAEAKARELKNTPGNTDAEIRVFSNLSRNEFSGLAKPSLCKVKNAILFFLNKKGNCGKTWLNNALFYSDFLFYRENGTGITGLQYQAHEYGVAPYRWNKVYSEFDEIRYICKENDVEVMTPGSSYDENVFTERELESLLLVFNRFRDCSPEDISDIIIGEPSWTENHEHNGLICYRYAFSLKAI